MSVHKRTVLHGRHLALGAKMVEFAGWEMPVFYQTGIVEEHLATRRGAGLFDISHMGRFIIKGAGCLGFLQHVLTNNAEALDPRMTGAQYTLIPDERGGAVDDAYLYRFVTDEYLLVVNAANAEKDWRHFQTYLEDFEELEIIDATREIVMLSLQGPKSRQILEGIIESGRIPEPMRNAVSTVTISGGEVKLARTGYTGEPLCFELFAGRDTGPRRWDQLLAEGATPIGLGARDTLRLEAGLPLYGHELGLDPEGGEMPLLAFPMARVGVSFSPLKGDFIGRDALLRHFEALGRIIRRDYSLRDVMPRLTQPVAVAGRGVARSGAKVFKGE
ncbi:MAG: glycine cleavage system protein T, partial [Desulfobacterales bacterium]|nr:glycine cleavage system protein T [Desulfobacterales bacterium]